MIFDSECRKKSSKGILRSVGALIYIACGENAQDLLNGEEENEKMVKKGSDADLERTEMAENNIEAIAVDTPTKGNAREVKRLGEMKTCVRKTS